MRIWIDADACPKQAKDLIVKFALKRKLEVVMVAGQAQIKPAFACVPRGREFDERNMGDRLAVRNLFTELREQGQVSGGQAPYGEREKQEFANSLDRILTRLSKA